MSPWLAIESATPQLSVALFDQTKLVDEILAPADGRTHAEKLLPLILELLPKNKVTLNDLTGVTYSAGPGSFTSLRVGLATAVGLCVPRDLPVRPVSTLKALALAFEGEVLVAPVLKAGRGRLYGAVFNLEKEIPQACVPEALYSLEEFQSRLAAFPQAVLGGTGLELLTDLSSPKKQVTPKASLVGRLAVLEDIPEVPITQAPLYYLQPPDLGGK